MAAALSTSLQAVDASHFAPLVHATDTYEVLRTGWSLPGICCDLRNLHTADVWPNSATAQDPKDAHTVLDQLAVTMSETTSTQPFRFLDLPAELRNAVYKLVVMEVVNYRTTIVHQSSRTPAITRTSRQIRIEALPVWQDIRLLIFDDDSTDGLGSQCFVKLLGKMPMKNLRALSISHTAECVCDECEWSTAEHHNTIVIL